MRKGCFLSYSHLCSCAETRNLAPLTQQGSYSVRQDTSGFDICAGKAEMAFLGGLLSPVYSSHQLHSILQQQRGQDIYVFYRNKRVYTMHHTEKQMGLRWRRCWGERREGRGNWGWYVKMKIKFKKGQNKLRKLSNIIYMYMYL